MERENREAAGVAKALTVKQPWAWAIIAGGKDVENRPKPTRHRGPLFIHAGLKDALPGWQFLDEHGCTLPVDPSNGGIIGIVDVVSCVEGYDSCWALAGEKHWVLENPEPLPFMPMKGELFMFDPIARALSRKEASLLRKVWRARCASWQTRSEAN